MLRMRLMHILLRTQRKMAIIISAFADEYSEALDGQIAALNKLGIGYIELRGADGKNVAAKELINNVIYLGMPKKIESITEKYRSKI